MANGTVQIAYLHREHVSHSWHESLRGVLHHDLLRAIEDGADLAACIKNGYRIAAKPLNLRCAAGLVSHVRNYAARLFLDKTEHEWLLFIDTDMGFGNDAAHRLLDAADPVTRPVVGALCFAMMEAAYDGMGGWRRTIIPTMYKVGTTDAGDPSFCYFGDYEDDTVTQVAATGGAFLLIHRGALEKLRAEHGDRMFDMMYDRVGDIVGEDIAFCGRLLKAGIIPAVHTGVKTTHHKEVWVSEQDYMLQEAVQVERIPDFPGLPAVIDVPASLQSLAGDEHVRGGMLKLPADLDRYKAIIEATRPEVIVETGTRTGASARWFAEQGLAVITVDLHPPRLVKRQEAFPDGYEGDVTVLAGDSADPAVAERVRRLVAGRRCMVSLDSDHSAAHVAREIELYGPLVSPGCYLVVEDTIFGYAPQALRDKHIPGLTGSPLDAIAEKLAGNPGWSRDLAVERMSPTSHHPAGFWLRLAGER